ncbi:tyrosine-type recombinase/integrase [Micromonospora haikouensis]|uniref:tyrosine-type recombinase/integrase n=1 Tax=Micromonospora haikouensis TaxID=686309 RepID=UPI003D71937F
MVPLIEEVRPIVARCLDSVTAPQSRLFHRAARWTDQHRRTARRQHWDEAVTKLGYERFRRHDLRHTGLTWMADAGVPVHMLRKIAGHGSLTTTQRHLHPDQQSITDAGTQGKLRIIGAITLG